MALNFETTRALLQDFKFKDLFIQMLGWSTARGISNLQMRAEELDFTLTPIAQLAGIVVFEANTAGTALPNAKACAAVQREVAKHYHENLIIFVDGSRSQSLWYWVKREGSRRMPRQHLYIKGQPGDLFLGKLSAMLVDISELDENGDINVLEVARRLQKALDVQPAAKKFFTDFAALRLDFTALITGIADDHDRRWYASVLLNRLMFIYFLQRKGFLDNGSLDYLQDKLARSQQQGADRYYRGFLKLLFFEGFAKPEAKRSAEARTTLGKIKYLNGGLFLQHPVEQRWPEIDIPDRAFENLFKLFEGYSWNLNDLPGGDDREINPDVLGYIFEKYINQKAFGAYYTRTEITEYLCERTIYRIILQQVNTPANLPQVAGIKQRNFANISELLMDLDAGLCRQLLFEILPKLSLLDPACGSGAFLVAAMKTLISVYSAVTGKIPYLNDKVLSDWLAKTNREHPNLAYFIKRAIITDNLFGVDIMDEAAEIARLRLFLALVASVENVEQLEPLPNIDFNLLSGNSLIGFLRVDEAAFNRRIGGENRYEQGRLIPNYVQGGLFASKTFRQIVDEKKRRLDTYRHTSSLTEDLQALRDDIQHQRDEDYASLNEMLLDEFSRLGIKYEEATWDEKKQAEGKTKKRGVQLKEIQALQPFHWGYEFDEVMNERGGFDAIITNPPWDIFKPNAKEFFAEYSDLVTKKKMDIKAFEAEQDKLLEQTDVRAAWLEYLSRFPHVSAYYRSAPQFTNQISIVNGKKAGSDTNLYKLFVEQCFNLLKPKGNCGMIIPSGIYTDLGTRQLRELLFGQANVGAVLGLSNEKFIFEGVHHSFKLCLLTFESDGATETFDGCFRINPREAISPEELEFFLNTDIGRINIPVALVRNLSPDSLSVMEFRSNLDIQIAKKMANLPMMGDEIIGWNLAFTAEFHMTSDSFLFKTTSQDGLPPLYVGKMIHQFNHKYEKPSYWVNEKEARSVLIGKRKDQNLKLDYQAYRLGFRDIARNTDSRTMISTIIPPAFHGNKLPTVKIFDEAGKRLIDNASQLFICAVWNSLAFDWMLRQKITTTINFFYLYQMPVPHLSANDPAFAPIVERAAKLICTTPEFDELAHEVGLGSHANGVTDPPARARLRAELDGMIAHLYGLTQSEFAHILATFPLVKDEVKSAAMDEFGKISRGGGR